MDAELIQIYYHESQKERLYSFAKPYFNEKLTIFFENDPIRRLVMATKAEKIGVCSWKLKEKLCYNLSPPRKEADITEELINSDYDVLPFTRNSKHHEMLAAAEMWHPGFKATLKRILDCLGINMPSEVKVPINQNHFMAKREIYQDYVKRYLSPVMDLIENDPEIYKLATVDSNYSRLDRHNTIKSEELQAKIGFPYYPLVPFLLERLFSIYIHNRNIQVKWL